MEQRCEDQCHDRHELDQDVDGRTGRIFERIADGVTNDSSLMGVAALAAVVAFFNEFLSVIPCAACIRHHDRQQYACGQSTGQHAAQCFRP